MGSMGVLRWGEMDPEFVLGKAIYFLLYTKIDDAIFLLMVVPNGRG